ncbi:MAG: hypothetical protein HC880_08800 [Bacteroidia bacterium]|nr:hypothetical protein [Bacteroidia bacterium]
MNQLLKVSQYGANFMHNAPTLVGQMGIPFDLKKGRAFLNNNFSTQIKALDASFRAIEDNILNVSVWNYTVDNKNEYGDNWNKEDFSVFSTDQIEDADDINAGGRALKALVRPYPIYTAGIPLRLSFDIRRSMFEFEFQHEDNLRQVATEIFVPKFQYPHGCKVIVSDGSFELREDQQRLIYYHSVDRFRHVIKITRP